MASIWKLGPSMLALMALGGCVGMSEGPVPISQGIAPDSAEPDLSRLRRAMQTDCFNFGERPEADNGEPVVAVEDDDAKQQRRNNLVTAYMAAADIRYNAYERNLLAFSRQNDLGASLATQLMSAIGAASGSQALSEATNITSGAIGATQSAFSKSLLNQTVSVLQTHMRARRATQAAQIIGQLAMPYEQWNTCLALREAIAYEHAGTLNEALAAMAASATDEERSGDAREDQAIQQIAYARDAASVALRAYIFPADRTLWAARIAVATRIVREKNLARIPGLAENRRLSRILNFADPARDADRRQLIQAILDDPTVDETLKVPLRATLTQ